MDYYPRKRKNAAKAEKRPDKRLVASSIEVTPDGASCVITTEFDDGNVARTAMPFETLTMHLHKLRSVAGQMVNRQYLFGVMNGEDAMRNLAATPLSLAGFAMVMDKLTSNFVITLQFTDMPPLAVSIKPAMLRDMNAEALVMILNAMN